MIACLALGARRRRAAGRPALRSSISPGSGRRGPSQDAMERGPGPDPVDYLGLPLNDEGRARALSYNYSMLSLPEGQCGYHTPFYIVLGPFGLHIWNEFDPVTGRIVAWKIGAWVDRDVTTIWMDGRPHPSTNAPRTYSGLYDRAVGRRHAGHDDDPHEGQHDPPQWRAGQRSGDDDHVHVPPWRSADHPGRHGRSGLLLRAATFGAASGRWIRAGRSISATAWRPRASRSRSCRGRTRRASCRTTCPGRIRS